MAFVPPVRPPKMQGNQFFPIQPIPYNPQAEPPVCPPIPSQNAVIPFQPPPQFQTPAPYQQAPVCQPPPLQYHAPILPSGPDNVHGRNFAPRIGYTFGDSMYINRLHIFHCLVCRQQHDIANPCPYIICCPHHRTLYVNPQYYQDKNFQRAHPHILACQQKCPGCQVDKVGLSSYWLNHMGLESMAVQNRQPIRLYCPVCSEKPASSFGPHCKEHLSKCPAHHQLFVSRHVDKYYHRHLVAEDFVCLECFSKGVPEGFAKNKYRDLRAQFERLMWQSGNWRQYEDDYYEERSFWGAVGGLLGGLM